MDAECPLAEALDGSQDVVGGFGPSERMGIAVVGFDIALDGGFELGGRSVGAALEAGTEHLRIGKRLVTVYLDNEVEKRIPSGTYTTEELISVLGVEAGYLLNVLDPQGKLVLLEPKQKTTVREGMNFFSQVPCGGSS